MMTSSKLKKVNSIAKNKGIKETIYVSTRKGKKFMVNYNNLWIHFGATGYEDFIDHKDEKRRYNYLKRSKGIRDKNGKLTWKKKSSPNFWSINILW